MVQKTMPAGMHLEWTGTFEHQVRADKTLRVIFPAVIALIALVLNLTHKSWVEARLLMIRVHGALAGGAIFQWLFGFLVSVVVHFSVVKTLAIPLRYLTNSFNDPCSSIETTYCNDQWRHLKDPKDFVMFVLKFQTFYDQND
jgi:AcrB/AcrD/AcrF family